MQVVEGSWLRAWVALQQLRPARRSGLTAGLGRPLEEAAAAAEHHSYRRLRGASWAEAPSQVERL